MVSNTIKGFSTIEPTGVLTISGTGGLIMPVGDTVNRPPFTNGLVRYNSERKTVEFIIDNELIELATGNSSYGTYLSKSGGTVDGDIILTDGSRIVLQGSATIDGMNPATIQSAFTGIAANDGFIVRNTATDEYVHRELEGGNGITVTNRNGVNGNPTIAITPYTLTIGGNITDVYGGEPTIILDGTSNTVNLYARVATTDIPNFDSVVSDKVGQLFTTGAATGIEVNYIPTGPAVSISAKSYDLEVDGVISGLTTIDSNRSNVTVHTVFTDKSSELALRGGANGVVDNPQNGVKLRYEFNTKHSYIEHYSPDINSALYIITGVGGSSPKVAAYAQDGKFNIARATIDTLDGNVATYNTVAANSLSADQASIATADIINLNMLDPASSANINVLTTNTATTNSLLVNNTSTLNGITTVNGPITLTNDVLIAGRLIVTGDASEVSSSNTAIGDNIISLNVGEVGNGVSLGYSGFEIDRGTGTTVQFVWDETYDMFTPRYETGAKAALGGVSPPVSGDQVGDRQYNDTRYLRDTTLGLNGFVVRSPMALTPSSTVTQARTILGGSGVTVTNGDGQAGNPTITLNQHTITLTGGVNGVATVTNRDNVTINTYLNPTDPIMSETVGDIVGGMVTGSNQKGIAVTYNDVAGKLDFDVNNFTITLAGDVTGTATITDLGNATITCSVVDNSHTHDTQYYTKTQVDSQYVNIAGDTMTGDLTSRNIVPSITNAYNIGTSSKKYVGVYATTFYGVAVQAKYADLAERYESDKVYAPGTVVVFGGEKEITITTVHNDQRVAGVISTAPALLLNCDAGGNDTHPYVALKGRVPCMVTGIINKGDLLVTSSIPGVACSNNSPNVGAVLGKALGEWKSDGIGIIEISLMG